MNKILSEILSFIFSPYSTIKRFIMNKNMNKLYKEYEELKESGASFKELSNHLDKQQVEISKYNF